MKEQTLEEVFKELDRIMDSLEKEDLTLEESFSLYHKGIDMLKTCDEKIETVEKQMKILDEEGGEHEF